MEAILYEYRTSWIVIGVFVVMALVLSFLGWVYFGLVGLCVFLAVLTFLFVNCFSLQILIADGALRVIYGVGLISWTVFLEEIQSCDVIPNNSLLWVYAPAQSHVLQLYLRNGGRLVVGLGDPQRIMELINIQLGKPLLIGRL